MEWDKGKMGVGKEEKSQFSDFFVKKTCPDEI